MVSIDKIEKKEDFLLDIQYTNIGNRIKLRRKELKIRQMDFAKLLDVSNNHISVIENGRQKPSFDMFIRICMELDVTPDYLILGNTHPSNIPQAINDNLRLCDERDIKLVRDFTELLVKRNHSNKYLNK